MPELRRRPRAASAARRRVSARHLYVHLPFCSSRCGYCDFVTVVGRASDHAPYVDALLAELALRRGLVPARGGELDRGRPARGVERFSRGGAPPPRPELPALERLLGSLPAAREVTVE